MQIILKNKLLLLIFFIALGLRIGWVLMVNYNYRAVEENFQEGVKESAMSMLEGKGYAMPNRYIDGPPLRSWREPGYTFFLIPIFFLFGVNYLIPKILFAILSSIICFFIYYTGKEIFNSEKVGLISSFAWAIFPEAIYWCGHLDAEPLAAFMISIAIFFFVRSIKKDSFLNLFFLGVTLGLAALTRAQMMIVTPILLIISIFIWENKRKAIRNIIVVFLFFIISLSPWIVRNYYIHKKIVIIPTVTGEIIYISNNSQVVEKINEPAGVFWPEDTRVSENMSELEIRDYFRKEAFKFIFSHPGDYLKLVANRFIRCWRFYPHIGTGPSGRLYTTKDFWVSLLTSGTVIILFLIGIFLSFKYRHKTILLLTLIFFFSLMPILAGKVVIRYRLPIMPYVINFASYTLYFAWKRINGREKQRE